MRVLVTGAAGFIGSHVCQEAARRGFSVVGVENFDPSYPLEFKESNLDELLKAGVKLELVRGDVSQPNCLEKLAAVGDVDAVIHLAARTDVEESIQKPGEYFRVNVDGTIKMLEFCRDHRVKRFILASSCVVYGSSCPVPFTESNAADRPLSPYAASKRSAELAAHAFYHVHEIDCTCLRFFSVYGPRQRPDMALHKFARLMKEGKEIPVFGDGTTVRDYAYVGDVVEAIFLALERSSGFNVYNIGGGVPYSTLEVVAALENALGVAARLKMLPERPGDLRISYASIDLARADLGYQPRVSLEEGVAAFAQWYERVGGKVHAALERKGKR